MKKHITLLFLILCIASYAQETVHFNFTFPALPAQNHFAYEGMLPIKTFDNELVRRKAIQLLEQKVNSKDFSDMYTYALSMGDEAQKMNDSIYASTMTYSFYAETFDENTDEMRIEEIKQVLTMDDLLVRPQFLLVYQVEKKMWSHELIQIDYCWLNPEFDPSYPQFLFTLHLNKDLKHGSKVLNFNPQLDFAVCHHLFPHADFVYNVSFLFSGEVNEYRSEVVDYRVRALKFYISEDVVQTVPYANLIDSNKIVISEEGEEMSMKMAITDAEMVEEFDEDTGEPTRALMTIYEVHGNRTISEVFDFELNIDKLESTFEVVGIATANYSYSDELNFRFFLFK